MDFAKIKEKLTRRDFLKKSGYWAIGAGLLGTGGYTYFLEPRSVCFEQVKVNLKNLPPRWQGRKIIQLTDLHCSDVVDDNYLIDVMKRVNAQKPDVIVMTGDYVSSHPKYVQNLKTVLKSLDPPKITGGRLAVLGNHDWWTDHRAVTDALKSAGFTVLLNGGLAVDGLYFGGVDDLWCGSPRPGEALAGWDKNCGPAILLTHNPDILSDAAKTGVNLVIAGHTHGGQVRFPIIGGVVTSSRKGYYSGFYRSGNTRMYVSRGVGLVSPPVRFLCPPEVTVFTL